MDIKYFYIKDNRIVKLSTDLTQFKNKGYDTTSDFTLSKDFYYIMSDAQIAFHQLYPSADGEEVYNMQLNTETPIEKKKASEWRYSQYYVRIDQVLSGPYIGYIAEGNTEKINEFKNLIVEEKDKIRDECNQLISYGILEDDENIINK